MTAGPVLALDSVSASCSAAVVAADGATLAHCCRRMSRGQAEALMPLVTEVMAKAGLSFSDLGGLAVTVGPGSFTGVRIGLAAARGLALASGLPLVGVSTFRAIERAVPGSLRETAGAILVALDTKRQDIYAEAYAPAGEVILEGRVARPEDLPDVLPDNGPILLAGDGAELAASGLTAAGRAVRHCGIDLPDPAVVARIGIEQLRGSAPSALPQPLYLRRAETTLPGPAGRARR